MAVLAHLAPSGPRPRAGWECPRCLTVYSPDVEACHCAASKPLSERVHRHDVVSLRSCTCALSITAPCPVHPPRTMTVIC